MCMYIIYMYIYIVHKVATFHLIYVIVIWHLNAFKFAFQVYFSVEKKRGRKVGIGKKLKAFSSHLEIFARFKHKIHLSL